MAYPGFIGRLIEPIDLELNAVDILVKLRILTPTSALLSLFFRNAKEVGKDAVEKDNSTENTNQKVEHIELFIHPWYIGLLGNRKLRQRKYQKGKPEL